MLGAAAGVLAVEMGRAAAKNQPYAEEEVTQLLLDTAKAADRIAWLDAGVSIVRCARCRRCSSILLFVAVIHVVVIAYRLSSYSHHRVSTGWAAHGVCQHASTHDMRRPHGGIFRTASSSRSDCRLSDSNVDRLGVLGTPLYAPVAHQLRHITLHG